MSHQLLDFFDFRPALKRRGDGRCPTGMSADPPPPEALYPQPRGLGPMLYYPPHHETRERLCRQPLAPALKRPEQIGIGWVAPDTGCIEPLLNSLPGLIAQRCVYTALRLFLEQHAGNALVGEEVSEANPGKSGSAGAGEEECA